MEFTASATIDAPPEVVWSIITDTKSYTEWDPFCDGIEGGPPALGAKLKAFTKMAPGRGFGVKVTTFDENELMVWSGGMPLGLFEANRSFTLQDRGDGRTHFVLREEFSGLLLPLFGRTVPDLTESFEGYVHGLKQRAEST